MVLQEERYEKAQLKKKKQEKNTTVWFLRSHIAPILSGTLSLLLPLEIFAALHPLFDSHYLCDKVLEKKKEIIKCIIVRKGF